jgi:hyperosmotically inducible protein
MNVLDNLKLIGVSTLLIVGLAACDKPGPAESAGKKLDQTADEARDKISEAADKVSEGAGKTVDKLGEQGDKAGVSIDDAEITAKVKAAIFAEPGLKTLQISVDTIKGVVTLSGSVDTQQNSDTAHALAGAVSGVHEVDNRLVIKPNK